MLNITTNPNLNTQRKPSFNGAFEMATQGFQLLNESPAIGATIVDVSSMALPRTIVDSKRGFNAGLETGIRETSGALNHALVGVYGLLGALAASGIVNLKYGIKAKNINADMQSVKQYSDMWQNFINKGVQTSNNKNLRADFMGYVLDNTYGVKSNTSGDINLLKTNKETIKQITDILKNTTENKNDYKLDKKTKEAIKNLLVGNLGTEQNCRIKFEERELATSVDAMLDDVSSLSKVFSSDKLKNLYTSKNTKGVDDFLKAFGKYKGVSTAVGLGLGCVLGASVQPLNRYLTKKRTGQDGFVGVDNNKKAESNSTFKFCKALAIGAMGALTYVSLGKGNLAQKIQFKGLLPTLNQLKLVYGLTLISRFAAARDTNELREATFKDFLGFTNWLILGGFVSKMVANKLDSSLIHLSGKPSSKRPFVSWLANSSLKTQSEILLSEAKKNNIPILKDSKLRPFKEILKETCEKAPAIKTKLAKLNIAQLSGLVYSATVLGWAIPKINILVTKKINEAQEKQKSIEDIHKERTKIH